MKKIYQFFSKSQVIFTLKPGVILEDWIKVELKFKRLHPSETKIVRVIRFRFIEVCCLPERLFARLLLIDNVTFNRKSFQERTFWL